MSNERYRVRDRNTKIAKGTVWGENLTYAEADRLKEMVCGSRKSTSARLEPMNAMPVAVPVPARRQPSIVEPAIVQAKAAATSSAAGLAAEAQKRHDALVAARAKAPVVLAEIDEVDGDPGDALDDLLDEVGSLPTAEDLEHARLQAEADVKGEIPPTRGA